MVEREQEALEDPLLQFLYELSIPMDFEAAPGAVRGRAGVGLLPERERVGGEVHAVRASAGGGADVQHAPSQRDEAAGEESVHGWASGEGVRRRGGGVRGVGEERDR